jgi:hypothetical protein
VVDFDSLNVRDGGEGQRRWVEAGRPTVPSLVMGGEAIPVLHVSQIAEALGLPLPAAGVPLRAGRGAAAILEAWLRHLPALGWQELLRPTPSRGRSLRNLTVNVFHPFELLPSTWRTEAFGWRPEEDAARERLLADPRAVLGFAATAAAGWNTFLDTCGADLGARDPRVATPRGAVTFSALLEFQRWHAAYHYRQLVDAAGVRDPLDLEPLSLTLPAQIY